MSSSRYPDNNRYPRERERSPYRDRRPSAYGGGYPPRANDSTGRPHTESAPFPPRDVPRGPKLLVDAPRGPAPSPSSSVPSGPRDGRGRGFPGRGDGPPNPLRDAPPLTDTRDRWRSDRDRDRDRDRDFERRERRPSPRARSPIRDARDTRDFPRDLDIGRARRNSRDGPPSAGSTYSDPPLGNSSSYRGGGMGRGRGTARDFPADSRGRGRSYHDDRDRGDRYEPRGPSMYRPRSRSREREPIRRDRDPRDEREFDRRDRDERRFTRRDDDRRGHDTYIGPGTSLNTGARAPDSRHTGGTVDTRHMPGTPTGPLTPHSAHHPPSGDRLGPPSDSYSRRSSVATEPLSAKDARRESDRNDLLASRVEASKERYAPRASSPPAAVPAFGFSNVWRNPALDAKPAAPAHVAKPVPPMAPVAPSQPTPAPSITPTIPTAPKAAIPSGLAALPPTGPKADRQIDRPQPEMPSQDSRISITEQPRIEGPQRPTPSSSIHSVPKPPGPDNNTMEQKPALQPAASSPPLGLAPRVRAPPTGPQAGLRSNLSPSFVRPVAAPYAPRDASPGAVPSGPRHAMSLSTSPKSLPVSIPTGPKADRAPPMAPRPSMYAPLDRQPFSAPRMSIGVGPPKSNQWVRPGLVNRVPSIPTKRDLPSEDRERSYGPAINKAPKIEGSTTAAESQRLENQKPEPTNPSQPTEVSNVISKPSPIDLPVKEATPDAAQQLDARRMSDVSMHDASPTMTKPPLSASAPEDLEDSDEDLVLDEADFAESEAKYNKEKALLESKRIDLSVARLRATSPLQEIMLLASITLEHLPPRETHSEPNSMEEEASVAIPPSVVPPSPENNTTELLTPKAEETEDVAMEEVSPESRPVSRSAPATRAIRPRRELSVDREVTPELSSLPWLRDGPPTPLSDLDHDRPTLPEESLEAIRNKLRANSMSDVSHEDILQQYAAVYKQWRLRVREFDEARDHEEQERPQSAEPILKVTTPDVQSSAMANMLEAPVPTGRRSHSSRWATELDLEQVIKESLKTAEEERMGKKDREPRKCFADPEREATLPMQMTEQEAQRRRFIDTNFQREPGQGIFVYHYEPPEDDFTETEHKIMVQHYRDQYAKKWGKLAEMLYKEAGTSRTYKDCINHYYATKWGKEYKGKVRGRRGGKRGGRGGGAGRGRISAAANAERSEVFGEDGAASLALTDSGRPRRQAAPTFGAESELDASTPVATPGRPRRQTDADGASEKPLRRGKVGKEKVGRKPKNQQPLAAAPVESPVKIGKERALGVKMEEEFPKRPLGELTLPMGQPAVPTEDQLSLQGDVHMHSAMSAGGSGMTERPKSHPNARLGPSSYWSVAETTDFRRNVAHFGTDWAAIANYMGTKTQTMVKNQYLRLVEGGNAPELARLADEADKKRARGEDLGPPPTPTPAQKRRYESSSGAPRALAPTPEVPDLIHSPATQNVVLPKASPPSVPPPTRFPTIAQAPPPPQVKPSMPSTSTATLPESPVASVPPAPLPQSPPQVQQPPRAPKQHHHHPSHSQHKTHIPGVGPRAGFFSDPEAPPPRLENRPPSQSSSMPQSHRPLDRPFPQQLQQHIRPQEPQQQVPPFRQPGPQEQREMQTRLEPQQDHEMAARFSSHQHPHHARRISQDHAQTRLFQPNVPSSTAQHKMGAHVRGGSSAASPEMRPLSIQQQHNRHPTQTTQPAEVAGPVSSAMASAQQHMSRSAVVTPPVKEEPRHYPLPPQQPQLPPQTYTQPSQPPQPPVQKPQPPPPSIPKPAPEPKKSSLLSLLNDPEPEEPTRRKKPMENLPSHTPTPQQQGPIAPPPPPPPSGPQSMQPRREVYENVSNQSHYDRPGFAPQAQQVQPPTSRSIVDLTNDRPPSRQHPRENWAQRGQFHPSQSQPQQAASLNSPHPTMAQPALHGLSNHRGLLSQANTQRHNPSPPPHSAYQSPHMHSRTPSLTQPPQQQPRYGMSNPASLQSAAAQILQPNPYAQVDPSGPGSQPTGPVGMRPSPHLHTSHVAHRDAQGRNEQSQVHNGNLSYSNPQTPSDRHPPHQPLRNGGLAEPYRPRDPREHEFDPRNRERDVPRELSQRAELLMRDRERDAMMSNDRLRSGPPQPGLQEMRYQPQNQPDRGYAPQRSHTPLSRSDHSQHPSLQHHSHSLLVDNNHVMIGQRQQDDPTPPPHRMREQYPMQRDDRMPDRLREEQQARMRNEEYHLQSQRERDARFREEIIRGNRDHRMMTSIPPSGPGPQGQEQRQPQGGPMDWTSGVRPPQQPRDGGWGAR